MRALIRVIAAAMLAWASGPALAQAVTRTAVNPASERDDDIARHAAHDWSWAKVEKLSFRENGYDWTLYRMANLAKPAGPLWIILHDNEDPAFDSGVRALKAYGGTLIVVSTTDRTATYANRTLPGSPATPRGLRCQKEAGWPLCDPNRNFGAGSPLYTATVLADMSADQPVIAVHTNAPYPQGSVALIDGAGKPKPGARPRPPHAAPGRMDVDTFVYRPHIGTVAPPFATTCGTALIAAGVNVQYEAVSAASNDGSLSNHLTLARPDIRFYNLEAPWQAGDTANASSRHAVMAKAVMEECEGL